MCPMLKKPMSKQQEEKLINLQSENYINYLHYNPHYSTTKQYNYK